MDYTFNTKSSWDEIDDPTFHVLRNKFINLVEDINEYIGNNK
jgi:hypothetical protein